MKTNISERESVILLAAFHIVQDIDDRLWHEYFEDKKKDGLCKFYGKVHKAARITSFIEEKMLSLFLLMDIVEE